MHSKKNIVLVLHVLLPLFTGGVIYILLDGNTYIAIWVGSIYKGMEDISLYLDSSHCYHVVLQFLRNYVCDGLWAYSATMTFVWYGELIGQSVMFSMFESVCFVTVLELFQLIGVWKGTFDLWDIVIEIACAVGAAVFYKAYLSNWKLEINANE